MTHKVYLAGGFKSGWQDTLTNNLKNGCEFFNPRNHLLTNPSEYTAWDLHYLERSDVVFAYMESTNPSGFGLALEVGFAKAMSKTIILVDEKSEVDESFARYFKIVQESSTVNFNNLKEGIAFLEKLII